MWYYTQQDIKLAQGAVLRLGKSSGDPIRGVSGAVSTGNIEFQFPPKVVSDSRKGNWEEGELRGTEPVAAFKTSGPREITLSWSYVVDSVHRSYAEPSVPLGGSAMMGPRWHAGAGSVSSGGWSIDRITKNIRTLRGYFALVRNEGDSRKNLVVEFRLWALGGLMDDQVHETVDDERNYAKNYLMSARLNSVDVKYGDTIVCPSGDQREAFFLRTDITVDLRLWTKMGTEGTDVGLMQDVQHMREHLTPEWY